MIKPYSKKAPSSGNPTPDVLSTCLNVELAKLNRHWQYTYHFPLSPVDEASAHDCNQRHVMLYGVGKGTYRRTFSVANTSSVWKRSGR